MGYYTKYSLTWGPLVDARDASAIGNAIESNESMFFALDRDGDTSEECKWYEHEEEMKIFSLKFPGVLFTLSGEGEEAGDLWKKYFRDGRCQIAKAIIDYPKFDAKLLK